MKIERKVFVVTGGGNGIGREVVLGLLSRGARVAIVDRRTDDILETIRLAGVGAERVSSHIVDVTDEAAVAALPAQVEQVHGQVDGLVNVAGIIQHFVRFADLTEAEMTSVMDVNFWGVVRMCKGFLPLLSARPEACVVNVSSMGAFVPVPGQTVYGASKAAVKLFTEGLYAELRGTSVAVTVVFPGGVATGIAQNSGARIPGAPEADAGGADADAKKMAASLTSPQDAAAAIIGGIERGSYRVVIGKDATMLDRLSRLAPQRATDLVAKKMASLLGH
ncbi:MAG: putative oxidoreductase SadH [bacterium ADurb.BinA028]|nr:MAG: putative oxidoreductase SadH [bacterium ADurb.BinA028]